MPRAFWLPYSRDRGVAQSGRAPRLGRGGSPVRIRPPRLPIAGSNPAVGPGTRRLDVVLDRTRARPGGVPTAHGGISEHATPGKSLRRREAALAHARWWRP